MEIEKYLNGKFRYLLSNENLKEGDKVYPIANGRCRDDGSWILHGFNFEESLSGFPDNPHTIINLKYSDYKPYEVKTDKGYSPIECYYKIIKVEEKILIEKSLGKMIFTDWYWKEIETI
ncbi:MAG: hypothetical protein ACOCVF_01055 [bacterium]